jgi:putative thiamine transport system permease protein
MRTTEGRTLRLLVLGLVAVGLVFPIVAGLWETGRAAFGLLPAIGAEQPTLAPWREFMTLPGAGTSVVLTLWTGVASTALSLAFALGIAGAVHGRVRAGRMAQVLTPFLATPHAAMAIGTAFLIAPSGWIVRLLSPWATGWTLPPDIATVQDRFGLALILGLMLKEVPFLLLVTLSALTQLPVRGQVAAAQAMGYAPGAVWARVIVPQVYPMIRLPVFVALSFALSVVDMALILGPTTPPTLAVAMTRWFLSADTGLILPASAAAMALAAFAACSVALWIGAERLVACVGRARLRRGNRGLPASPALRLAAAGGLALLALGAGTLLSLALWSVAWRWSFPRALPESWSLAAWTRPGAGWGNALEQTLILAVATTALSLALAIAWLEGEDRAGMRRARWAEALIYLPLLVPQAAFLFGLSVVLLRLGLSGGLTAVIWGQMLFVFPYVMLALSDPWRALDRRMDRAAAALGAGPWRRLLAVKLPILLRPVLTAAAIGFAVSVAQYLPTLFLGAGRVSTLTTEAVTLASGSDRRVTAVYATMQSTLPLAAYGIAMALPAALHRRRRAMSGHLA